MAVKIKKVVIPVAGLGTFESWRFNLRESNTEQLMRLNVESRCSAEDLTNQVAAIAEILVGGRAKAC